MASVVKYTTFKEEIAKILQKISKLKALGNLDIKTQQEYYKKEKV